MKELIDKMFKSKVVSCLINYDGCDYVHEYEEYAVRIFKLSKNIYKVFNFDNDETFILTCKYKNVDLILYALNYKYLKCILSEQECYDIDYSIFANICKESKSIYDCVETIIKSPEYLFIVANIKLSKIISFTDQLTKIIVKEYMTPNPKRLLFHNYKTIDILCEE